MATYSAATEQKALQILDEAQDGDVIQVANIYQKAIIESRAIGRGLNIIVELMPKTATKQ